MVTQSGGDGGLSALVYDPANTTTNLTQTQAAQDANFTVNGFAATSASNQVTSVISGVTLNLLKTTAVGTPTTLTVGTDTCGGADLDRHVRDRAQRPDDAASRSLTSYDPSTQTAGPLLGNATLQSFQNQLHEILGQVKSGNRARRIRSRPSASPPTPKAPTIQQFDDLGQCADGKL